MCAKNQVRSSCVTTMPKGNVERRLRAPSGASCDKQTTIPENRNACVVKRDGGRYP